MATKKNNSKRRIVHMPERLWNEAETTSRSLGLSISQFLSRLVIETAPLIRPGSLLGLQRTEEPHTDQRAA
jgi:hypothetical protein